MSPSAHGKEKVNGSHQALTRSATSESMSSEPSARTSGSTTPSNRSATDLADRSAHSVSPIGFPLAAYQLMAAGSLAYSRRRRTGCSRPKGDEAPREGGHLGVGVGPVVPGDLVVLAVGVVVALLGAAELVAAEQHAGRPRTAAGWRAGSRRWLRRSAMISGSSVGPSTPQFHERLSSVPSRLSSPLASLCLSS